MSKPLIAPPQIARPTSGLKDEPPKKPPLPPKPPSINTLEIPEPKRTGGSMRLPRKPILASASTDDIIQHVASSPPPLNTFASTLTMGQRGAILAAIKGRQSGQKDEVTEEKKEPEKKEPEKKEPEKEEKDKEKGLSSRPKSKKKKKSGTTKMGTFRSTIFGGPKTTAASEPAPVKESVPPPVPVVDPPSPGRSHMRANLNEAIRARQTMILESGLKFDNPGASSGSNTPSSSSPTTPAASTASESQFVKVESSFNKPRVARVEFRPEGTFKTVNITPRTSPLEAFEGLMNKISKGLPPEHRDTLVAKYANYTLYRHFEDGKLQAILSDEPLLSPLQIVGTKEMPKFLFTDQKIEGITTTAAHSVTKKIQVSDNIVPIKLGDILQETHMKEEKKAFNAIDELVMTERKFLFDTDLMIEMVLKPLSDGDIISHKLVKKIFLNIEQINVLHRELYRRFQLDNSVNAIAEAFDVNILKHFDKVYTTYLGNYENSLSIFYDTRDHSDKFKKFLAKLSNESPVFKDRSLNNLLVTPMQRVCKYELLLKNVISQELKRESPDHAGIEKLQKQITKISYTLQRIDNRRKESDNWETILRLEETLALSEPLRKRGRVLLLESSFNTSRRLFTGTTLNRYCTVILFNDILLRAYKSNKTGQYKVLDITNLNQLVLVDPKQLYSSGHNMIILSNIDPRGAILEFELPTSEERQEWYNSLCKSTVSMNRLCMEWELKFEKYYILIAVDDCTWTEAHIERCRIFITTYHICLTWESFGSTQKELIPLHLITDIEPCKDNGDRMKTSLWNSVYTLTKFNNYTNTTTILKTVWQSARRDAKRESESMQHSSETAVPQDKSLSSMFLMSNEELDVIYKGTSPVSYPPSTVILEENMKNDKIFRIAKGTAIVTDLFGNRNVLTKGDFFGVGSFINGKDTRIKITANEEGGVDVLAKSRDDIINELKESNPILLAKFFATLANSLTVNES